MTPILAPTTPVGTADQMVEALATYVDEHSGDIGGNHQRTMLLVALLVRLFDVTAEQANDLARNGYDDRVRAAGQARDEILTQVERARYAAEQAWTPNTGDTVTWNGHDGVWTITSLEDDDHAWLRLQRVPGALSTMADTFADYLARTSPDIHFGPLAAIADLRPANTAAEVTSR